MIGKKIFKTSKHYNYAVYSNGNITKNLRGEREKETPLNRYSDDNGVFVWAGKNKQYAKALVARYFMENKYNKGCVIEQIDGDIQNCSIDNLRCVKRDNSNDNKIYTRIMLDGIEYNSIAAAERVLFVSNGYLTKYFKGQVAGKLLEGHEVRVIAE